MNNLIATTIIACAVLMALPGNAQTPANPNDTIVRFDVFTEGTNVGSIDIELFDQDKPETVQNFLLYVYSSVYSNLVIHRLEKDFVLQAGTIRVPNPNLTNQFIGYVNARNYGRITNEFSSGPRLSNLYGTIAMARIQGLADSASGSWFINLNDNTSLDEVDGGFTVFGRVVNTTGASTGTNFLNWFNANVPTASASDPLVTFSPFDANLTQIPFTTNRYPALSNGFTTNAVEVRDLFTIRASIIHSVVTRDNVHPRLVLKEPKPSLKTVTTNTIPASGTSSDNMEVYRVLFTTPNGVFIARGAENWTADLGLSPGTNVFNVTAMDRFGNESRPVKRSIFYQKGTPIALTNSGPGTVIGATNGQLLDIGRFYTLQARPDKGNLFLGWQGYAVDQNPKIPIFMQFGFTLTAVFSTNYFQVLRGMYAGVMTTRSGGPRTTGWINLNLSASGAYAGRLAPFSATYPIHGAFRTTFSSSISGQRGNVPLGLTLRLATNGTPRIEGTYSDGVEVADVVMYRLEQSDPGSVAGHYTFEIQPLPAGAGGDNLGIGTADVLPTTKVTAGGTLDGGVPFNSNTAIYSGNHWPIYSRLSSQSGIVGWMELDQAGSGFSGNVQWVTGATTFRNGHVVGTRQ